MPNKTKRTQITCDVESTREYTREGFLKVKIHAGKVGVQRYSVDELGVEDIHGTGFVNVARLSEEITKPSSLDSLEFKDITISHPDEKEVNAKNYARTTVGLVTSRGRMANDNIHIVVDGLIKDADAIKQVESGKNQVSLGYDHYIEKRTGTLDGESYDYVQTDILYNHLAIVHRGRAKTATILDSEVTTMNEEEIKALQAENENLKKQVQQLANDAENKELETTITMAKSIDADFEPSNKTAEQIKRDLLGDKVSSSDSLDVVNYAFKQLHNDNGAPRSHKPVSIKTGDDDESKQAKISQDADDAYSQYLKDFNEEA